VESWLFNTMAASTTSSESASTRSLRKRTSLNYSEFELMQASLALGSVARGSPKKRNNRSVTAGKRRQTIGSTSTKPLPTSESGRKRDRPRRQSTVAAVAATPSPAPVGSSLSRRLSIRLKRQPGSKNKWNSVGEAEEGDEDERVDDTKDKDYKMAADDDEIESASDLESSESDDDDDESDSECEYGSRKKRQKCSEDYDDVDLSSVQLTPNVSKQIAAKRKQVFLSNYF
jgi:hypothetical protein